MEEMGQQPLGRREFNKLCAALGLSLPAITSMIAGASTLAAATGAASNGARREVKFHDGTTVPAFSQGSANLGQGRHPEAVEEEALRTGLSLGMTLIDTAEGYGNGRSEELIGHVIAGQRDRVFLVSKVAPNRVTRDDIARACEASLARLGTDYLDLYLLREIRTPTSPALWRRSKVYARRARFALGACPTSTSAIWKTSSVFHTVIAVRSIRSITISEAAVLSMICCRGASRVPSRGW